MAVSIGFTRIPDRLDWGTEAEIAKISVRAAASDALGASIRGTPTACPGRFGALTTAFGTMLPTGHVHLSVGYQGQSGLKMPGFSHEPYARSPP
jgi:hypothetical protein